MHYTETKDKYFRPGSGDKPCRNYTPDTAFAAVYQERRGVSLGDDGICTCGWGRHQHAGQPSTLITDAQIEAVQEAALASGDDDTTDLCQRALEGSFEARRGVKVIFEKYPSLMERFANQPRLDFVNHRGE